MTKGKRNRICMKIIFWRLQDHLVMLFWEAILRNCIINGTNLLWNHFSSFVTKFSKWTAHNIMNIVLYRILLLWSINARKLLTVKENLFRYKENFSKWKDGNYNHSIRYSLLRKTKSTEKYQMWKGHSLISLVLETY